MCEPSGDVYSGPLVLGVRQGDGIVRSGDTAVAGGAVAAGGGAVGGGGAAEDGAAPGAGAGAAYWGSWGENRFEGEGRQLLPSGEDYIGQWRGGVRHGRGCWQRAAGGAEEYDGEWAEGARHGRGTLTEGTKVTKVSPNPNPTLTLTLALALTLTLSPDPNSNLARRGRRRRPVWRCTHKCKHTHSGGRRRRPGPSRRPTKP